MRRSELVAVLAGLACALSLLGGATAAVAAPLPPAVEGNLAAITEFQYRMLNVTPSPYGQYPVCHRGCQKLWKAARALSASNSSHQELWREMFFLGKSTSMFGGFGNYVSGQMLPTTPYFEEYGFGNPRRYIGVKLPQGATGTSFASLAMPGQIMTSSSSAAPPGDPMYFNVKFPAPTMGWFGGIGSTSDDPGHCPPSGSPDSPGPDFVDQGVTGFCPFWTGTQWTRLDALHLHVWFTPIIFDGPPNATSGTHGSAVRGLYSSTTDRDFATAKAAIKSQLENGSVQPYYAALINWFDLLLGGAGAFAPTPESLYGGRNPGAPNLVHTCAGDPVDCATGNFYESFQDTRVAGPGVTLSLGRSYNSQVAVSQPDAGALGYGWTGTFRDTLEILGGGDDIIVHQENGSQVRFSRDDENGSYSPDGYVQSSLTKLGDGTYKYVLPTKLTLAFSADGRLLNEIDGNGNVTTLNYTSGLLTSVTDPVGRSLTFTNNPDGTVATATDPAGKVVHYNYTSGNLTSVTDIGGEAMSFAYDSRHRLTVVTDARGHDTATNVYDGQDRVTSQTDAQADETTWDYSGGHTTITDPSGSVTRKTFVNNLPTAISRAYGTPSQSTQQFAYDDAYNMIRETDPNGEHWGSEYDLRGNRTATIDPLGHRTTLTYDDAHHVRSITKPSGAVTSFGWDSRGNLIGISKQPTDPGRSNYRTFGYDARGLMTSTYQGSSTGTRYWIFTYDARGNRTTSRSPLGNISTATYDLNGIALTSTTPRGKTTTTVRNAYALPVTVTDPLGKTTTYGYDVNLNLTDVTDRDGHHDTTTFDALDRPVEVHRADGSVWKTSYTSSGEIASQTNGEDHATTYSYDSLHRVTTIADALDRETHFGYDPAGNKTSIEQPGGATEALTYDDAGRLTGIDYSSATTHDISYGYNIDDLRTSMTDGTGTTTYVYDGLGRLRNHTSGTGQKTIYNYDDFDRVTSIDYPDALAPVAAGSSSPPAHITTGRVTRTYDKDDRITAIADWRGNTTTYSYDIDDNLTGITRPNGVNATYAYDNAGRRTSLTDGSPAFSLTRSDNGFLTATNDGTTTASFSYDAADRVTAAYSRSYAYDDADNLAQTATIGGTAVNQHFDDAGQLTSRSIAGTTTATFDFDAEGRRTTMTPTSGTATALTWTQSSQLASYTGPDATGVAPGAVTEEYGYDGDGNRQTKISGGQRTHEAYDLASGLPLMITDGPTAYIYGPDGLPLEQITSAGTVRWYSHDQLGSTTKLTDNTGATVQSYTYDAYGQLTSSTPTIDNPFRYAGQYTDDQTGLQYLRARYYDPTTGQFLSRDPLESTTQEPYSYADNNPINATDPSGLLSFSDISDGAAGALDGLTGGLSTQLAGSIFNFDVDCADFGAGFKAGQIGAFAAPFAAGAGAAGASVKLGAWGGRRILSRLADETGSVEVRRIGRRFTPDQDALIQLAKEANHRGGLTREEGSILVDWTKELGLKGRGPEAHPGRGFGSKPHFHIGPVNHIPLK